MTFPTIDPEIADAAALLLAGGGASRAAIFTEQKNVQRVVVAIRQAVNESANCEICGIFHPMTAHPANTHSYATIPKLERESGGDKSGVWTFHKDGAGEYPPIAVIPAHTHDHAMCDPDRDCGPDNAAPDAPALSHWMRTLHVSGSRAGKTAAVRALMDASQDAGEEAAMRRLNEAADLKESLRWTTAEALRPATEAISRIGESLAFPGGRMWAENTEEDHPVTDCCPEEGATPGPGADPEDKLRIIAAIVDSQAPLGSDLANFRRRLALILDLP